MIQMQCIACYNIYYYNNVLLCNGYYNIDIVSSYDLTLIY